MFVINRRNINTLTNSNALVNSKPVLVNSPFNSTWLKLKHVENNLELSQQYAYVCQQHKQKKKWVLMINPDEASLDQLASFDQVDTSKVLCVNTKPTNKMEKIDINCVKKALSKGNCSAVILSNTTFNAQEIAQLNACAQAGETQCILLKNTIKPTSDKMRLVH